MIRGISFLIPNEWGNYLHKICNGIDITNYSWRIGDGEIIEDTDDHSDLFKGYNREISGTELKSLIESKNYYTIFADLQAYPTGNISSIETYEEFIQSECEIIIIIIDSIYTAIYCKNAIIRKTLYQNALEAGFTNIEYISDENDFRTRITAW
ncbi:DUF2691 family protein [Fredinandcohnia sp. 179-A 10B2 NHS]|uniref:DUF2691 family protein n=1 Tax=Fredinandcohnia sp. 179-A 10B2 NHS TaxID=3235176 RepID=UPI0039A1BEF6